MSATTRPERPGDTIKNAGVTLARIGVCAFTVTAIAVIAFKVALTALVVFTFWGAIAAVIVGFGLVAWRIYKNRQVERTSSTPEARKINSFVSINVSRGTPAKPASPLSASSPTIARTEQRPKPNDIDADTIRMRARAQEEARLLEQQKDAVEAINRTAERMRQQHYQVQRQFEQPLSS
ncbi:MAG: hypothetical protein HZB76_00725 [Chlamydiae bacterium]|nr:hypothetical protein [Chlamydiota bacterium]